MTTNQRRLAITSGMALSLVLTGAGIASAQTALDPTSADAAFTAGGGFGQRGPGGRGPGGRGFGDGGFGFGDRGAGILAQARQLVRTETVLDLGEDGGIVTKRVEHGIVAEVVDGSLTFALATGEVVTVTTDEDTEVLSISLDQRPVREDTDWVDVTVGTDVLVWSDSQADGSFLASRVTIVPAAEATEDPATDPAAGPEASEAPAA